MRRGTRTAGAGEGAPGCGTPSTAGVPRGVGPRLDNRPPTASRIGKGLRTLQRLVDLLQIGRGARLVSALSPTSHSSPTARWSTTSWRSSMRSCRPTWAAAAAEVEARGSIRSPSQIQAFQCNRDPWTRGVWLGATWMECWKKNQVRQQHDRSEGGCDWDGEDGRC
ncbi:uncharacterized protein LOC120670035 [Panicum virgatum]|uniref:Uncharacterized protein n=1 Tax=Panicum virgatum TaxID=38727 RepID=A0A8T0TCE4_PANVG|nr:uncharacterized protein LOC120670035 [Panicum virgatum]KAG2606166.1 hypothetical protein PVAP13_4NG229871 [Panicum virgatum]